MRIPNEFANEVKGFENVMHGVSGKDVRNDKLLLKLEQIGRLPSEPPMYVCKKTGSSALHHVDHTRVEASRSDIEKLAKPLQQVLWLKVGAIVDIGVSTNLLQTKIRTESGFLTIPEAKLMDDVFNLLGLGSMATMSRVPGKLIKRIEENLREVHDEEIEL